VKKTIAFCATLLAAAALALAAGPANVPDLTKSSLYQEGKNKGKRVTEVTSDMNLGPTGLRGWIWAEQKTTATREISGDTMKYPGTPYIFPLANPVRNGRMRAWPD
jgi:hypothetical protein